jgi:Arm domain-containing DNA-binding protein
MAITKLTEKTVRALEAPTPSGKQELVWDEELPGFAVLCSGVSDVKTYVAQTVVKDGPKRRVTIGRCDRLKLAEAREAARACPNGFGHRPEGQGWQADAEAGARRIHKG